MKALYRLLLGVMLVSMAALPVWGAPEDVLKAADEAAENCHAISQKIFEFKELGEEEVQSSQLLMEELKKLGYTVTGDLAVPADLMEGGVAKTAFKAELNGNAPGPAITIMLEYDALPNGHACGHNLIAASGMVAASALAKIMPNTPGKVIVMGTPAEESSSGKIWLLEGKHFEGTDVALITHGSDRWSLDQRLLAIKQATFVYKGKASHAAASPEKGISALDATLLMFHCVDMMREHVRQDARIHGVIVKGGERPNIVPDLSQSNFFVRALDSETMLNIYDRVVNCAKAGEIGTGATLEFTPPRTMLSSLITIPELINVMQAALATLGIPEDQVKPAASLASSDFGNVGSEYPTVNLWFPVAPEGTALHTDAFREAAASEEGWKGAVLAGKAVALTAYDLLTHPDKVEAIKAQFQELKAK
ncbi:peptidase M20D family protein [Candidatus Vecturithrix granuli]|uniref:Peptidase M20 domain-containing protein 2 n=1 Tax=Vecturithrix granuli TaxID=1499967 RepID=A0A081C026_VECG1|nr:peptidase M20D family protein [Candidatus Vecturithrix granuli]